MINFLLEGVMDVEVDKFQEEIDDFSRLHCIRIPLLMRCGFLTVDPFVRVSMFIAKHHQRYNCWRILGDFHCQECIQFHNCLFMRSHFTIGGHACRRTARFRQSIHFSITQVLFADHVH